MASRDKDPKLDAAHQAIDLAEVDAITGHTDRGSTGFFAVVSSSSLSSWVPLLCTATATYSIGALPHASPTASAHRLPRVTLVSATPPHPWVLLGCPLFGLVPAMNEPLPCLPFTIPWPS